ncbi:MAG: ATP-binding cassette domain-containing protein [Bdellovibrio sp.]
MHERDQALTELDRAKRERTKAKSDRVSKIERQEKRNRQGQEFAQKTGMSKIQIGARKRQAQTTTGKVDASTMAKANTKVREAYEAYREIKIDPVMYADLIGIEVPSQKLVVEAKDYNVFFDRWIYNNDLNFSWRGNIRLAIKGANGSGKTTLVSSILGKSFKIKGEIRCGKLATLYLDQQCSILNESISIFDNIHAVSKMTESEIRNNLAKLLFTGESVFKKVQSLSGGERLRAALACGLLSEQKPELLILDEPTNNLDLGNIKFLENLISQFRGAVILISHDEIFLKNCGIDSEIYL